MLCLWGRIQQLQDKETGTLNQKEKTTTDSINFFFFFRSHSNAVKISKIQNGLQNVVCHQLQR